jgi:class 3 adenylate cyclase
LSDIESWLTAIGLAKYAPVFAEAEIDLETLPDLVEDDLKDLGLPLGPRRKIWGAVKRLSEQPQSPPPTAEATTAPQTDAERRHLTVMFVDLVGSTEMATRVDAEDMRDVITSYQNTVAGVVSRYEGFVAKFMGDGVLCYFGWPRANEDDAQRAVRAGLSIIDSIRTTTAPDGTPLATRVGIATGVVIVGDLIGSGATQEAAVVGETPNLAARLQRGCAAEPAGPAHRDAAPVGGRLQADPDRRSGAEGLRRPDRSLCGRRRDVGRKPLRRRPVRRPRPHRRPRSGDRADAGAVGARPLGSGPDGHRQR